MTYSNFSDRRQKPAQSVQATPVQGGAQEEPEAARVRQGAPGVRQRAGTPRVGHDDPGHSEPRPRGERLRLRRHRHRHRVHLREVQQQKLPGSAGEAQVFHHSGGWTKINSYLVRPCCCKVKVSFENGLHLRPKDLRTIHTIPKIC